MSSPILVVVVICLVNVAASNNVPDNRGREFLIAFGDNYPKDENVEIFITTDEENVEVNVSVPLMSPEYPSRRVIVTKNSATRVEYPPSLRMRGTSVGNISLLIQCSADIVVYATNKADASADAFLAIPTDILGTLYYVASFPGVVPNLANETDSGPQVGIVATQDNTIATFTIPANRGVNFTYQGINVRDGDSFNVTLNKYQTFQLQVQNDLTGTRVTSNKPIAVVSGNKRTYVQDPDSSDHIEEMIPPVNTWGRRFTTVPLAERTGGDIFRILASESDTSVNYTYSRNAVTTTRILSVMGDFLDLDVPSDEHLYIMADKAVFLSQFSKTSKVDGANSDPMMVYIPPMEQFDNRYSFVTVEAVTGDYNNYVNIVIETRNIDGLRLNDEPIPQLASSMYTYVNESYRQKWQNISFYEKNWTIVADTEYSANTLYVPHGSHVLFHVSQIVTFGAIMYGQVIFESYGYPAGSRFATIGDYCEPSVVTPDDGYDNDCDGRVDEELWNGLDDNGDGDVDEDIAGAQITTQIASTSTVASTTAATQTTVQQPSQPPQQTSTTTSNGLGADSDKNIDEPESDNTGVIVGVVVPILVLAMVGGGLCIGAAILKRRKKEKEDIEMSLKENEENDDPDSKSNKDQTDADSTDAQSANSLTNRPVPPPVIPVQPEQQPPSPAERPPSRPLSYKSLRSSRVSPAPPISNSRPQTSQSARSSGSVPQQTSTDRVGSLDVLDEPSPPKVEENSHVSPAPPLETNDGASSMPSDGVSEMPPIEAGDGVSPMPPIDVVTASPPPGPSYEATETTA